MIPFELSNLTHTWFIDIDGTIFEHNGYKNKKDALLPGVKELWQTIPKDDVIILVTGRPFEYKDFTMNNLAEHNLRYDHIIFGAGIGERIVVNDIKPGGLKTAIAWNVERNGGFNA